MSTNTEPKVGSHSPWGRIDNISVVATGILFVGTESHGGVWLSDERIAQIPDQLRVIDKTPYCPKPIWWEEDCEAGFPLWYFGVHFDRQWHHRPDRDFLVKALDYFGERWIKALKAVKVTPVCTTCRSDDVTADACARWDDETQEWTLCDTYDNTDCQNCNGECHTFLVPTATIPEPEPEKEEHVRFVPGTGEKVVYEDAADASEHRLRMMEMGGFES